MHVEIMDEYRMVRRELMAEVSEGHVRSRRMLGWMDGVKVVWATDIFFRRSGVLFWSTLFRRSAL